MHMSAEIRGRDGRGQGSRIRVRRSLSEHRDDVIGVVDRVLTRARPAGSRLARAAWSGRTSSRQATLPTTPLEESQSSPEHYAHHGHAKVGA